MERMGGDSAEGNLLHRKSPRETEDLKHVPCQETLPIQIQEPVNSGSRTNLLCSIILAREAVGLSEWDQSAAYKLADTDLGEDQDVFSLATIPVYKS